jgi:ferric-dicitrate binding protein FerR (iron transport regulator)
MAVADSDELLTFPQARVRLRFTDGALVTFGPNSRCLVAFHRREADREGDILQLIEGILRVFTAEAAADSLKVRTRSAIATPRGTEWIVERTPGSTAVFVIDGIVTVRGAGAELVLLTPGLGTDVPDGAPPADPKRWGQARVDDVLERTSLR